MGLAPSELRGQYARTIGDGEGTHILCAAIAQPMPADSQICGNVIASGCANALCGAD